MRPVHLIHGPDGHGVTEYGRGLAGATRAETATIDTLPTGRPVHVTFTDHLFGDSPDAAVDAVLELARGRSLSVSVHDVPQVAEGAERFNRRARAYRRLASEADLVVTNSRHESAFFDDARVRVVHLPIPDIESRGELEDGTVGILGFIYPGKGHETVIESLAGSGLELRALGRASDGHEEWAERLHQTAHDAAVPFTLTGYLSDDELAAEMARIEVPVCAHRHYSASGSLMTWIGAGRRVLASDSPYTREIAELAPGLVTLVRGDDWAAAIREFRGRSADAPPPRVRWGWHEVAAAWERLWSEAGLS